MKNLTILGMKPINGGNQFLKVLGFTIGKIWGSFVIAVEDATIALDEYRGNY